MYEAGERRKGRALGSTDEQATSAVLGSLSEEDWKKIMDGIHARREMDSAGNRALTREAGERYREKLGAMAEAANDTDYGSYRKDTDVPFEQWAQNPGDMRAHLQEGPWQLVNGLAKGVVTTGTTYLDNTAGLVGGLLQLGVDAVNGGGFDARNDFITGNVVGNAMQAVRDWSEKVMPNYRTDAELADADQWWKHLNWNFWGDSFLKNLGFTAGAALSGGTYAKGFRLLQGRLVNKAYKAAAAAAVDGNRAAEDAFREVMQGGLLNNPSGFQKAMARLSGSYGRLSTESMLVGSVGGAIGESRTEALGAAKEFRDEQRQAETAAYEKGIRKLEADIQADDSYWTDEPVWDGYGRIVDYQPALNDAGRKAYEDGLAVLGKKYASRMEAVDSLADGLGNTTFWLNMPLLLLSNMIMFGRMFAGGFRTQATARPRLGADGLYRGTGTLAGGILQGLKTTVSEGSEEIIQKMFSEGAKDIASARISSFNDGQYDKTYIKGMSDWMSSMVNSAGNVLGTGSSWEEFAIGALTGAIGSFVPGGGWGGGIYGGIRDARLRREASDKLAQQLNERTGQAGFRDFYRSLVRHNRYEDIKRAAVDRKDKFIWHTADESQLISDVMLFSKAGRLRDLTRMVDRFADMSPEEADAARPLFTDDTDPEFSNKSGAELASWLKERAKAVKETIKDIRDFSDTYRQLSQGTTDDAAIEELVYTGAQLKDFESRYRDILDGVTEKIRPSLEAISGETDTDGKPTQRAVNARSLLDDVTKMRRLFGGAVLSTADRTSGERGNTLSQWFTELDAHTQEKTLQALEDIGAFAKDPSVKEDVKDLQKIVRARQKFYAKLIDPRFRQTFAEDAKTAEKTAEELAKEARAKKVDAHIAEIAKATTVSEYLRAVKRETGGEADSDVVNDLNTRLSTDPATKKFEDMLKPSNDMPGLIKAALDRAKATGRAGADEAIGALHDVSASVEDALEGWNESSGDIRIPIAKALLDRVISTPAEPLMRDALEEVLGDIAKANGFGKVPAPVPTESQGHKDAVKDIEAVKSGMTGMAAPDIATAIGNIERKLAGGAYAGLTDSERDDIGRRIKALKVMFTGPAPGQVPAPAAHTDDYNSLISKIRLTDDYSSPLLADIIAGNFSSYSGLTDSEKLELMAEAKARQVEKRKEAGLLADGSAVENPMDDESGASARSRMAYEERDRASVNGMPQKFMWIDTKELKRSGKVRRRTSTSAQWNAAADWMHAHKVDRFIDSGALEALDRKYRAEGGRLPVYMLANPVLKKDNFANNPFAAAYKGHPEFMDRSVEVLFAVEMNDADRRFLSKYEDNGVFSGDTLITAEDGRKYQVIGLSENPSLDHIKEQTDEGRRKILQKQRIEASRIWEYAIRRSVLRQYRNDLDNEKPSVKDAPDTGVWYVARETEPIGDSKAPSQITGEDQSGSARLYTTLNYIGTGRNRTHEETDPEGKGVKVQLKDALHDYVAEGKGYSFILVTKDIDSLPPGFLMSVDPAPGSLFIRTEQADGSATWSYVGIAHTDEVDWHSFQDTVIGRQITGAINGLFSIVKKGIGDRFGDISLYTSVLEDRIYLGKGNRFTFGTDPLGRLGLYIGTKFAGSAEEAVRILREGSFRFQVSESDAINDAESLVNSGILTSDIHSFDRYGANIGVNFLSDTDADGRPMRPHPVDRQDPVSVSSAAGRYSSESDSVTGNIRIGNSVYSIGSNGNVYNESGSRTGSVVDNRAVRSSVLAIGEVMRLKNRLKMALEDTEKPYLDRNFLPAEKLAYSWYEGRRWLRHAVSSKGINVEHTNYFERDVDGMRVRMVQDGKAGVVHLFVGTDEEWAALVRKAEPVLDTRPGDTGGNSRQSAAEKTGDDAPVQSGRTGRGNTQDDITDEGGGGMPRRRRRPSSGHASTPDGEARNDDDDISKTDCG